MTEPELDLSLGEPGVPPDAVDVYAIIAEIKAADSRWKDGVPRDLADGKRWTPHLMRSSPDRVLHVHLSDSLPGYVSRRLLAAAQDAGVVLALRFDTLYDENLLRLLGELDAYVFVIQDPAGSTKVRHYLAALADLSIPVSPVLRQDLARQAWSLRQSGTDQQRGARLEALLAFLLSQVADFKVFSRNHRTETAEIDIVVQVDNFSSRCWSSPGVPFVHVEAKNWTATVGQPQMSLLIRRLQTARGRAKLGLLFATSTFSDEARMEELRLSETDLCVAMFDADGIETLFEANDLDQTLEEAIGRAMLR